MSVVEIPQPQRNPQVTRVPSKELYTYDELCLIMEESNQPHELWDGELIMAPAPFWNHQQISFRVGMALFSWVNKHELGEVAMAPIDMVLSPHQLVQPDVVFISKNRLHIVQGTIRGAADLVVEVISPGGRQRDRIDKKDLYEQHGIKEYWIIDPESQSVDVYHLEESRQYALSGRFLKNETAASRLLEGFQLNVRFILDGK